MYLYPKMHSYLAGKVYICETKSRLHMHLTLIQLKLSDFCPFVGESMFDNAQHILKSDD